MSRLHISRCFRRFVIFVSLLSAPIALAEDGVGYSTVGKSTFHVGWFHVYDAELRAPGGAFSWGEPFELELTYARKISQSQLVSSTFTEMARTTGESKEIYFPLREPLEDCFEDVVKGDSFLARRNGVDEVQFYLNGDETCRLQHPDISKLFFGIWLSDHTRSPKQSRQLRGL